MGRVDDAATRRLPEIAFESKAIGGKNTDTEAAIYKPLRFEAKPDHEPDDHR
jgi:hypothetical protein